MLIELNKTDIVSLIKGSEPQTFAHCEELQLQGLGKFVSGPTTDEWVWDTDILKGMTDRKLYHLFYELRTPVTRKIQAGLSLTKEDETEALRKLQEMLQSRKFFAVVKI